MLEQETKKILDPKTIAAISDFRLLAQRIVDGYFVGQHRGPRHAFSLEYSKHRDYYPGDPLKLIDWKLYGKTDRFSVKQFEEETNLQAWLMMDISRSMNYGGKKNGVTKLQYASFLAAAFAYLLLEQKDLVGCMLFDDQLRKVIPASSAARQLDVILRELKALKGGNQSNFEKVSQLAASRIKKRGMIILFSDLLGKPETLEKSLKSFLHSRNELIIFQILSFEEIEFPFKRFSFFEDMETQNKILLQPALIREEYRLRMKEYLETVKKICGKLKISYQLLQTTTPFDQAMTAFLECRERMSA